MSDAVGIIDRMKRATGMDTNDTLGAWFSTPKDKNSVSSWKKRGRVPIPELIEVCQRQGVSLDWLVFGEGPALRGEVEARTRKDLELLGPEMKILVEEVHRSSKLLKALCSIRSGNEAAADAILQLVELPRDKLDAVLRIVAQR